MRSAGQVHTLDRRAGMCSGIVIGLCQRFAGATGSTGTTETSDTIENMRIRRINMACISINACIVGCNNMIV